MKVTKRQLKRLIREEKRKLIREQDVIPPREEHVDTYYDDDAYGQGDELDPEVHDLWNQIIAVMEARFPNVDASYFGDEIYDAIQTEWAAADKENTQFASDF